MFFRVHPVAIDVQDEMRGDAPVDGTALENRKFMVAVDWRGYSSAGSSGVGIRATHGRRVVDIMEHEPEVLPELLVNPDVNVCKQVWSLRV